MQELTNCPNCGKQLKGGIWSANELVASIKSEAINYFTENKAPAHCQSCVDELLMQAYQQREIIYPELQAKISELLPLIPVVTLQHPYSWEYTVIDMVTSQSVTGTGVITEISSSWTDFFGGQSDRLSNKLKQGELTCLYKLRYEASLIGANAVIATDIDYAEVGGQKGMLMVCMSGTAVKLHNISILKSEGIESISILPELIKQLEFCNSFSYSN